MKKTIIALLAAAGMAMGGTTEVKQTYDTETGCYKLTDENNQLQIKGEAVSVAVTLDVNELNKFTEDYSYLFTLNGTYSLYEESSSAEGMLLNSAGEEGYELKFLSSKVALDGDPLSKSWSKWDNNLPNGYSDLAKAKFDLTSIQAISIILTVDEAGTNGTANTYVFVTNNENITTKYAGYYYGNAVNTNNITLLEYDEMLISSIQVYDGTMSLEEADALGVSLVQTDSPTVPEPTTATLSLLALAGLAARRRRR